MVQTGRHGTLHDIFLAAHVRCIVGISQNDTSSLLANVEFTKTFNRRTMFLSSRRLRYKLPLYLSKVADSFLFNREVGLFRRCICNVTETVASCALGDIHSYWINSCDDFNGGISYSNESYSWLLVLNLYSPDYL
jgi:hypothetical protein